MLPIWSLWKRELVRFYRQKSRVVGAIAPPLLVWFFIGSGFGQSFTPPGAGGSYLEYFYPGIITLVMLFTAIFSAISVIEDRRDGFLHGVLVTPIPRSSIVMGKILGGATQAFIQAALLLLLSPLLGMRLSAAQFGAILGAMGLIAFGLTALGCATAWRMDSTQGFHAIMNLVLMPMWVLSGAFFPLTGAPVWMRPFMLLNPLTYGVAALRSGFYADAAQTLTVVSFSICVAVMAGFSLVAFGIAVVLANRTRV